MSSLVVNWLASLWFESSLVRYVVYGLVLYYGWNWVAVPLLEQYVMYPIFARQHKGPWAYSPSYHILTRAQAQLDTDRGTASVERLAGGDDDEPPALVPADDDDRRRAVEQRQAEEHHRKMKLIPRGAVNRQTGGHRKSRRR